MSHFLPSQEKKLIILSFLSVFFIMLIFSCLTPLCSDDFTYCFDWSSKLPIRDFYLLRQTLIDHRNYGNGRIISHFFVYVLLTMPKIVFNILNALVTTLLSYTCYRYFRSGTAKKDLMLLALFVFLVWCLIPTFGQSFLWLDGSCNYSWAALFLMLYMLPFFREYVERPCSWPWFGKALFIPAAFIAGAYSENGSFSILFFSFCVLVLLTVRQHKLPRFLSISFVSCSLGFLFLMSAPSEFGGRGELSFEVLISKTLHYISRFQIFLSRFSNISGQTVLIAAVLMVFAVVLLLVCIRKPLLWRLVLCLFAVGALFVLIIFFVPFKPFSAIHSIVRTCFSDLTLSAVIGLFILSALYLALLILGFVWKIDKKVIIVCILLFLSGLASIFIFIFAKYFVWRASCFYVIYTSVACILMMSQFYDMGCKTLVSVIFFILAIMFIFCFVIAVDDICSAYRFSVERLDLINTAIENGEHSVVLEAYTYDCKYSGIAGLIDMIPGFDWPNGDMALYYGIDEIISAQ